MTVEAAGFIDDIDPTQPPGTDNFSEGDDHLRNFKKSVQDSFPNISGAMTADEAELNSLDGYTGNTADLNILDGADAGGLTDVELLYVTGVTSAIQTQLDGKETYIQSVTGTVAASALTVGLGAGNLNFRNATLTSGAATANTNIALSLVVPNGATLGTSDTVESDLILLAIDNAGATELAIVNGSGTLSLDEKALISTTAIGTGSDSADVAYSTTARSNVAFRVVGLIRSTQATAGAWATSPSLLQGHGGNALATGSLSFFDSITQLDTSFYTSATTHQIIAADTEGTTTTDTSYVKRKEISVSSNGTLNVYFEIQMTGAGSCYGRIYVNGSAVGTERSVTNGSYTAFSESVSVVAGDLVQLYTRITNTSNTGSWKNLRLRAALPSQEFVNLDS